MLRVEFTPLEIDEAALAFDAHLEVGHGGHFLGAEHTMSRFRDCFYRPLLSSSMNFERWSRQGALDAAAACVAPSAKRCSTSTRSRRLTAPFARSSRSTSREGAPNSATNPLPSPVPFQNALSRGHPAADGDRIAEIRADTAAVSSRWRG